MSQTQIPVVGSEQHKVLIKDEKGEREEIVTRYVVANPSLNPIRTLLDQVLRRRRGTGKEGIPRSGIAAIVSAADTFNQYSNPTLDQRKAFAGMLKANRISTDEAEEVSGIKAHLERFAKG